MSVYDATENSTFYVTLYMITVTDTAEPLLGWSLVADPAVLGTDLDIAGVTATRTSDADGSEVPVTVITYTQSAVPTVTIVDTVEPGTAVIYTLSWPKISSGASGPARRSLRSLLQLQSDTPPSPSSSSPPSPPPTRGVNLPVVGWSAEFSTSLTLPPTLSGPKNQVLAKGNELCTSSSMQLDCVSVSLGRSFSAARNSTSMLIRTTGFSRGADNCSAWLAGLALPTYVRLRLSSSAAAQLAQDKTFSPRSAFISGSALVLPYTPRVGTSFTFRLDVSGAAALQDICEGGLPGQLPDTCVVDLLTSTVCASTTASELSTFSVDEVGIAPEVHTARPPPPPLTDRPELGVEQGSGGSIGGSSEAAKPTMSTGGLSNSQVVVIVCLVAGSAFLAFIVTALFVHLRRTKFTPAKHQLAGGVTNNGTPGVPTGATRAAGPGSSAPVRPATTPGLVPTPSFRSAPQPFRPPQPSSRRQSGNLVPHLPPKSAAGGALLPAPPPLLSRGTSGGMLAGGFATPPQPASRRTSGNVGATAAPSFRSAGSGVPEAEPEAAHGVAAATAAPPAMPLGSRRPNSGRGRGISPSRPEPPESRGVTTWHYVSPRARAD